MAKKRKVKVFRLFLIIFLLLAIIISGIYLYLSLTKKEEPVFNVDDLHINELNYSDVKELPIELHSKEYLLIRLNDFKVEYAKGNDKKIYPASLTKVLTMNTILNDCKNINETSSYSDDDWNYLVSQNASMAGLYSGVPYTIKELLYALILPSGGDAAIALSNYATSNGKDLVEMMNSRLIDLNLNNSHFTNPTGLHDDDLYTTLDDYAKIVINTLLQKDGKEILKSMSYLQDGHIKNSSLKPLEEREDSVEVFGGKTGYTLEAGMNIMTLYEVNNRSYLLILANAEGSPYTDGQYHIDDVNKILEFLYN